MPTATLRDELSGVWAELLGRRSISWDAHFFDLGGHSLLAVELAMRASRVVGFDVESDMVLRHPVFADFVQNVERLSGRAASGRDPDRRDRPARVEPTAGQRRIWRAIWSGEAAVPHVLRVYEIGGRLDLAAMERAARGLVDRHAALRESFHDHRGMMRITLLPVRPVSVAVVRADAGSEARRRRDAIEAVRTVYLSPFDVTGDTLLRLAVVRLSATVHYFVVVAHELVCDGWSMNLLVREFGLLYDVARQGKTAELPALPSRFEDVVRRRRLSGHEQRRHDRYWRNALDDAPAAVPIPTRLGGLAPGLPMSELSQHRLARQATTPLARLVGEEATTRFTGYLAGLVALVHRYTGMDDVVITTPVANRDVSDIACHAGLFATVVPVRVQVSGDMPFRELVRGVAESSRAAFAHAGGEWRFPNERLGLRVTRPNVLAFRYAGAGGASLRLAGCRVRRISPRDLGVTWIPRGNLVLSVDEKPTEAAAALYYSSDALDGRQAERFLRHYGRLLALAAAAPGTPLAQLVLTQRGHGGGSSQPGGRGGRITRPEDVVRPWALARDTAVALEDGRRHITYGELLAALSLSHDRGSGPADILIEKAVGRGIETTLTGLAAARHRARALGLRPDDRCLFVSEDGAPPWVTAPWTVFAAGAVLLVPPPGRADLTDIRRECEARAVTVVFAGPRMAAAMLDGGALGSRVRLVVVGTAIPPTAEGNDRPLAHPVVIELAPVDAAGPVLVSKPQRRTAALRRLEAAPLPGPLQVDVRHADGTPVLPGGEGQLWVRVPKATPPGQAASPWGESLPTEWQRMALAAGLAADGAIEIGGPVDDELWIQGCRLGPKVRELEHLLSMHPEIEDAAVVWHRVKALVAFVTVRSPVASELDAWVVARMRPAVLPWRCVEVHALPRREDGFVDRPALSSWPIAGVRRGDWRGRLLSGRPGGRP